MTILGAYQGEGCVVLASDSRVTEDDGSTRRDVKLWFLRDLPVAWGFSGDDHVGGPFRKWMKAHPWPKPLEWSVLLTQSSVKLHALNAEAQQGQRAEVLLVAFIDGKPHVAVLFKTPGTGHEEHGASPWFVGSGASRAFSYVLDMEHGDTSALEIFRLALEHALPAPMCGPPVKAVRVRAASVSPVDGFDSDTRTMEGP